ncbi:MAG: hypothetical protein ACRDGQ_14650 [Candidatus Limnocylindrales bacterium]
MALPASADAGPSRRIRAVWHWRRSLARAHDSGRRYIAMFKKIALMGTLASLSATGVALARRESRRWGIDPVAVAEALPGDDLVSEPTRVDTRTIEIAAPPEQVWPWLVQMGYKRAGWYSYDAIDMNQGSSRQIVPEFQSIEVGQVLPTHPDGGFLVKVVEPGKALVLYLDTLAARDQAAIAHAIVAEAGTEAGAGPEPQPELQPEPQAEPNIRVAGSFLNAAVPGWFAASWAFVLEPTATGGTRLIERFRVTMETRSRLQSSILAPILGFGVFAMTRRQMLGIRDRAEAASGATIPAPMRAEPAFA